jgi:hypothetical protein
MKKLYSILITLVALIVFASPALADPGNTWDLKIDNGSRFTEAFEGAIIDAETGRVWEKAPSSATVTWFQALSACYMLEVGGRKGWRLPTVEELASLTFVDPVDTCGTTPPSGVPCLPGSHPFENVLAQTYWTATSNATNPNSAWRVSFFDGRVDFGVKTGPNVHAWCVRGGQGIHGPQ